MKMDEIDKGLANITRRSLPVSGYYFSGFIIFTIELSTQVSRDNTFIAGEECKYVKA
jgi:hypothetical protein